MMHLSTRARISSLPARKRQLRFESLEERRLLAARAADAVNAFAMDLYEHLQQEEGNLFYSPLSISTALAMAYSGAAGQTALEMEQVLNLGTESGIHDSFSRLLTSLQDSSTPVLGPEVIVSNALWPDDDITIYESFLDTVESEYSGYAENVDYSNPEQAKNTINNWVSKQTRGLIPNLVSDLDPATAAVLTNSVYFKGFWETPFDPRFTELRSFSLSDGESIDTQTMFTQMYVPITHIDGFSVIDMPFEAGLNDADLSMVIMLPSENTANMITPETYSQVNAWLDGSQTKDYVDVRMPKFNTLVSTHFDDILVGLGMQTAFDGQADFSGMTPAPVFINKVFHQATLEVTEQGTEAAAATEIEFLICFAAGTPVLTPDGEKPIEQLQAGDEVLARDENNVEGPLQPKQVEKVHHGEAEILELHSGGQIIRTTATHPFFVMGKGWTAAGSLQSGDLLSTAVGKWEAVNRILSTGKTEAVYNFRVADHHTYFVGSESWGFALWAHNSCVNEFYMDRPFHMMIRDNTTSSTIFMGRIDDPSQLSNQVNPNLTENADFNYDSTIDGSDFLAWQRGHSKASGVERTDGDSNYDRKVDAADLANWVKAYGEGQPAPISVLQHEPLTSFDDAPENHRPALLVDAVMASESPRAASTLNADQPDFVRATYPNNRIASDQSGLSDGLEPGGNPPPERAGTPSVRNDFDKSTFPGAVEDALEQEFDWIRQSQL